MPLFNKVILYFSEFNLAYAMFLLDLYFCKVCINALCLICTYHSLFYVFISVNKNECIGGGSCCSSY